MMKIVLAEDDRITLGGIASMITHSFPDDFEITGEATDGEEALRLVTRTKPDLLLTDINMPKLNGLDLIRRIRENDPDILIIIITGYNDFEYIQSAIQSGVSDYLLKPVLPEQIRRALLKAKEQTGKRQEFLRNLDSLRQQVLQSRPILRERFLHELISGSLTEDEIREKSGYLQLDLSGSCFAAAVFKAQNYTRVEDLSVRKEDLMQFFLSDAVNRSYGSDIRAYSFAWNENQAALIFCAQNPGRDRAFREIMRCTSELVERMQKYLGVTLFASLGRLYPTVIGLRDSFREAKDALVYSFSMQEGSVISCDDLGVPQNDTLRRPAELDDDVILHTKLCERAECAASVRRLFGFYTENNIIDPRTIKVDVFDLIMRVFSRTESIFQNSRTPIGADFKARKYQEILSCETLSSLEAWTLTFFEEYIGTIEKERTDRGEVVVAKVKEIAENQFPNEDFSLDDVAAKLFISPNYLRMIFKQKTGRSFVEYLTELRMKKAAELLVSPALKVQQVSEEVGYDNQQYFAMCFRRHFGCTPTEYRRLLAQRGEAAKQPREY